MCRGQCSEHFNWCVPIYIIVNSVGWELVLGGANASRVTWHHRLSWNIVTNHLPLIMNQFASKQSQRPKPICFKAYRYVLKIILSQIDLQHFSWNQFASKQSQRPKPIRFQAYRYVLKIILSQIDLQHFMVCHCIPSNPVQRTGDDTILILCHSAHSARWKK